jgi:multiple sugar transport system substrate-binding protein
VSEALKRHIVWLMSADAQRGFLPRHEGQPARREAWTDPEVDGSAGGFYSGTLATTEAAWVRPRRPGYTVFQTSASALIRESLSAGRAATATYDELEKEHRAAAG